MSSTGGSVKNKIVNPDLAEERAKCNFDQEEVYDLIYFKGFREYYKPLLEDIRKYPNELMTPHDYVEMTRDE
jgi:hypothetical protein